LYSIQTKGVCAKEIKFSIKEGLIEDVNFLGGCPGNLIGISALVKGMKVEEVVNRLENTKCGSRATSCPDQLAKALKEYM